ncbi:anti-sigma factor domain-containing protein [Clostridium sporogenes]|uniref:anti-sigma factor domain-containing protein n=1 Tax=Clostridium sporogenes TaxID=1509 RepID=UPI002149B2EB|nr:anti-sigma factor domain-containing protein [Clostridium sporogenes]MCR1973219.1 anti-sigma factor domain-containing protein [Clostridium sporogenes]
MNKKGIVMEIHKNKIGILTSSGEFIYVANSTVSPDLGEIYESEEIKLKSSAYKNIKRFSLMASSLLIIFICSIFIKTYNAPVSSVTIKINPSIRLQANRWNKVINVTPLNEDGTNLLKNLNLKNKGLEKGIDLILEEAKKENYINNDYKNSSKAISINFTGDTSSLNLSNIENNLKNLKVKYNIKSPQGIKTNYNKDNIKANDNNKTKLNNNKTPVNKDKNLKDNDKNNNSIDKTISKDADSEIKKYNGNKKNNISNKENNNMKNNGNPNNTKEKSNSSNTKTSNTIKNNSINKSQKNKVEVDKNTKKEQPSENKNGKTIKGKSGSQK